MAGVPMSTCPRCGGTMFYSDVHRRWMHSEETQDASCGWG